MNLYPVAVLFGYDVEEGVPAQPRKRRYDLVSLCFKLVDDLEYIATVEDAGFHAASFSTQT